MKKFILMLLFLVNNSLFAQSSDATKLIGDIRHNVESYEAQLEDGNRGPIVEAKDQIKDNIDRVKNYLESDSVDQVTKSDLALAAAALYNILRQGLENRHYGKDAYEYLKLALSLNPNNLKAMRFTAEVLNQLANSSRDDRRRAQRTLGKIDTEDEIHELKDYFSNYEVQSEEERTIVNEELKKLEESLRKID